MAKERIQYIDIAKGIGIALVVLAHSKFPLNHFVTMFYLPMFFFISGCFYSPKSDFRNFLLKKTKQLYLKFVYIGIILLLLHPVFIKLGFYNSIIPDEFQSNYMKSIPIYSMNAYLEKTLEILSLNVPEQLMRPMWFIGALWIAVITLKFLDYFVFVKVKNKYIEPLVVAIVFAVGYYSKLPSFIGQGFVSMLFCWLGSKCMREEYLDKLIQFSRLKQVLIVLAGLVICGVASLKTDLIMMANTYTSWWTMLITSCVGTIAMLLVCYWISGSVCGKVFSYIGQHTIAILSMHMICFKFVNWIIIYTTDLNDIYMAAYPIITNDGLWWIAYSVVGLTIPLFIQHLYNTIKIKLI